VKTDVRPVLEHGPRSLACAQVEGLYEASRRTEMKHHETGASL